MTNLNEALNGLFFANPWLEPVMAATAEAVEVSQSVDTCPDWFGRLVRATVGSYSQEPGVGAEDGGWVLSAPLLGTQRVDLLRGRILGYRVGRELYTEAYSGRPALGMFKPPDCQSLDRKTGHGLGRSCNGCSFRRRNGCQVRGYLLFLPAGEKEPVLVLVPRSSFDGVNKALDDLKKLGTYASQAPVVLAVQPNLSARGRKYGRVRIWVEELHDGMMFDHLLGSVLDNLGRYWFQAMGASLIIHRQPVEQRSLAAQFG